MADTRVRVYGPDRELRPGHDRCDRCGARAYYLVYDKKGRDLLFCVRHGRESTKAMSPADYTVYNHAAELAPLVTATARAGER